MQTREKGMVSGVNASLSALEAYGRKLANNSNNVANMNTEGYKKGRVLLLEERPQGVRTEFQRIDTPGPRVPVETSEGTEMVEQSNVDLAEEFTGMITGQRGFEANLAALGTFDEMEQSVLDIKA